MLGQIRTITDLSEGAVPLSLLFLAKIRILITPAHKLSVTIQSFYEVFTRDTTETERTQLTLLYCVTMLFVPANSLALSYN
jgi:hypothetical protein